MAAFMTLCAITTHLATIWNGAKKVHSVLYPMNPIVSIHEIPLYNLHHQVVATQIEFRTKNGWVYCFCIDAGDHQLHLAIRQEFPVGANISKGVCQEARTKMIAQRINHRLYFDPIHGQKIFILMSPRSIDLSVFKKPHWVVM